MWGRRGVQMWAKVRFVRVLCVGGWKCKESVKKKGDIASESGVPTLTDTES